MDDKKTVFMLSNRSYDILRAVVQYVLPGLGTLYFAIASIWGLMYAEQIVGTIAAITAFGGVVLGISRTTYKNSDAPYDGNLVVDTSATDKDLYSFEPTIPIEQLPAKDSVTFKVVHPDSQ